MKAQTLAGAALDKASQWPETMVSVRRAAAVRKSVPFAMKQEELWPREGEAPESLDFSGREPDLAATPVVEPETVSVSPAPVVEARRTRAPAARKTAPSVRRLAVAPPVVRAEAVKPARNMARFLNVNGAIQGMGTGVIRFDLPGRAFSKALRLWKGTADTGECTPVYF